MTKTIPLLEKIWACSIPPSYPPNLSNPFLLCVRPPAAPDKTHISHLRSPDWQPPSQGLRTCQVPRFFPTSSASMPPSLPVRRATSGCGRCTSSAAARCGRTWSVSARRSRLARASGAGPWRSMVGWRRWMWSPAMQLGQELGCLKGLVTNQGKWVLSSVRNTFFIWPRKLVAS